MKALFIALSTLTLFPSPVGKWAPGDLKASVVFYPLVGGLLGAFLAFPLLLPIPSDLRTLLSLLIWVVLTMAFHLDGLGDCLDGWLGGKSPAERRRIMKDPALGVYGTTGIALVLLFKYALLGHLLLKGEGWKWLIAIPAAARWAVALACFKGEKPPKDRGLGSKVLGLSLPGLALATLWTLPLPFLLGRPFLPLLGLCAFLSLGICVLSKRLIGGLTGDGMGALVEACETSLLFLACLVLV